MRWRLNYLGYMLADRGTRLDEALGYIRRAVALDPQNGAYLDSLGWAYYKMGNYELAEENLRRASERTADDPTIHDHLAELYQKTGRLKLAATYWQRSLEEWNKTIPAEVDADSVAKRAKGTGNRPRQARQTECCRRESIKAIRNSGAIDSETAQLRLCRCYFFSTFIVLCTASRSPTRGAHPVCSRMRRVSYQRFCSARRS